MHCAEKVRKERGGGGGGGHHPPYGAPLQDNVSLNPHIATLARQHSTYISLGNMNANAM